VSKNNSIDAELDDEDYDVDSDDDDIVIGTSKTSLRPNFANKIGKIDSGSV